MKRILCMLVLICLMPFASPAKGEGIYYEADEYIQGLWAAEGEIYALDGQRVVRLTASGGEVQTELKARYAAGAYDGENLWGVRFDSDAEALLMERIDADGGAAQTISFEAWDMDVLTVRSLLAAKQGFCLITQDGELIICRREGDEAMLVEEDGDGYTLCPLAMTMWGEEGVLLAGADGTEIRFYILDLETGEARRGPAIACMDATSFGCLMAAGEQLTFVLDDQLWQMEGLDGEPQPLREANLSVYYGSWGLLVEDGVVLAGITGAESLNFGEPTENMLRVKTDGNEWVESVARRLGQTGLNVEISSGHQDHGDVSQAILVGSDAYDVYVTSLSYPDYDALYKKGYLLPLEDEEIALWATRVYPEMVKAFTIDGEPVALPVGFGVSGMACNPNALENLGIQEIPTTWLEFFRLLAALSHTGTGDYYAFDPYSVDLRENLFYNGFLQNALLTTQQLEDPRGFFDTPEMQEILAEFEKIDFNAFTQGSYEEYALDAVIFEYNCDLNCDSYSINQRNGGKTLAPMPLSFRPGETGLLEVRMDVAIINPYGQNRQEALMMFRALLADMPQTMSANLQVGWSTPIPLSDKDSDGKIEYLVSSQDLACYQKYAGNMRVWHNTGLGFAGEDMLGDLVGRYLAGNMSAAEFLQALDEKWSMMLLERE